MMPASRSLLHALRVALLTITCVCLGNAIAQNPAVSSRQQVEQRLNAVSTLLETSSGAKQIELSGNAAAADKRNAARALHREAVAVFERSDYATTSRLLDEAARTMFEAVRLASPEQVDAAKDKRDFDARLESTKALYEAQKRISKEKNVVGNGTQRIEGLLTKANSLAANGDLKAARTTLDEAYLAVKSAVRGMRSGDTLVRSLNFATREEEYRYELDRNDTHMMLVNLLLQEKRTSATVDAMVQKSVDEAGRLRKSAEAFAGKRDFESGIRSLEDSTRELVRAIRSAGVYIPG